MTWSNRLRLYGGLILVIAVVAALTLVFNQRRSQALSLTGHVVADQVTVGAQFGGVVVTQHVADGDTVKKGQDLFTVVVPRTVGSAGEVVDAVAATSNDAYVVDSDSSTVTYRALTAGKLADVGVAQGGFVQSGSPLATITAVGSEYVVAKFRLSPRDYERVTAGARVDLLLPDNSTVQGKVGEVSVTTEGGQALTDVTISSDELRDPSRARLAVPGTPVSATLSLRDDGPLAGPTDAMFGFMRKIGLR
jgi:multidrug resistance efflux pump